MKLKQMIKIELEKDKTLAMKLAKLVGFKNPTPIYKYLNDSDREFDSLDTLLTIVRELFPDKVQEILDEDARTVDPNKKIARHYLEYARVNRYDELCDFLIEKLSNCCNSESQEWAKIYQIDKCAAFGTITQQEALNQLECIKTKHPEVKAFCYISRFYRYYSLKFIPIMTKLSPFVDDCISQIKSDFIKQSYTARQGAIMTDIHLYNGELETARSIGEHALQNCNQNTLKSILCLQLGNSYLFESYEKANNYFHKSLQHSIDANCPSRCLEAKRSLNFLNNYWGNNPPHLNYESRIVSDVHEVAFYYIRKNNVKKAMEILNSMDSEKMTEPQKGYHFYYRGIATGNLDYFYKSITHFNKSGDKFFKNVSLIELQKHGVNEVLLEALAV